MKHSKHTLGAGRVVLCLLAGAVPLVARPACAQNDGYHVGENRPAPPAPSPSAHQLPSASHRLARVEYVNGNVTWRANDTANWAKAGTNRALNEGSQLWVEDGGRVEVRFDDGSVLRLGSNSVATLQTVFVDPQGEYTQIKMLSGIATLLPREERSVFEVNTPFISVKTVGPSRLRVGVGDDVEVAVSQGHASLDGPQGKTTLNAGDYVSERAADTAYAIRALPAPDSWERWNDERDRKLAAEAYPVYHHYAPSASYTSVFFSLGFPIYGGYHAHYGPVFGRGAYRHRW
jgi:hypothetical protein